MTVYKFTLNEEYSHLLDELAEKDGMSVQDYIRSRIFNLKTIFTPVEALNRALSKYEKGDFFTLPELYGDDWIIQRGFAGVFGKQFFNYVAHECPEKIAFNGMADWGRHAQYIML